jgi:hypothetical protein
MRMPLREWMAWTGTVFVPAESVCRQWTRMRGRCRHSASAVWWGRD